MLITETQQLQCDVNKSPSTDDNTHKEKETVIEDVNAHRDIEEERVNRTTHHAFYCVLVCLCCTTCPLFAPVVMQSRERDFKHMTDDEDNYKNNNKVIRFDLIQMKL